MTPTLFALFVCAGGLLVKGAGAIYLQLLFCLFGAAAAVLLPALGGASVTPAVMFLPFLIMRAWMERRRSQSWTKISRAGFWLLMLALWGVLGAIILPRVFAGEVQILTVDRSGTETSDAVLMPIRPVSGNITQSGYALGSVFAFLGFRSLLARPGRPEVFRDAVLLLTSLNCVAALLNLGEYYLGFPPLLSYVKNATYVMFGTYEWAGMVRLQGTFPETSMFSLFTLPLLAFSFSLWLSRVRPAYTGMLALASLGFLLISTSGTAYGGLALYGLLLGLMFVWNVLTRGQVPRLGALIVIGSLGLLIIAALLLLRPDVLQRVQYFFEVTVFNKFQTSSGTVRSSWNAQAWSNFLDTYGVGVGLGSARASSYALVLLSNVGAIGTLLFVAFLASIYRGTLPASVPDAAVPRAGRQAVLASLCGALISGTVFDLGVAFYAFAAAASMQPVYQEETEDGRSAVLA